MKKVLLIIVIVIVAVILGVVLYLGYLGFIPGLSSLFGSDKPRDLGVTWTAQDYATAHAATKVEVKTTEITATESAAQTPGETLKLSGSHPAQVTMSSSELTSVINTNSGNWKYFPVSNVQVKINTDGSAQMSGLLNLDRFAGYAAATGVSYSDVKVVMDKFGLLPQAVPFYISATPSVTNNIASMNIGKAELGRASVPQNLISENAGAINGFFTQQLNAFPGFSAKSANFNGGKLNFDGTLTDVIETIK